MQGLELQERKLCHISEAPVQLLSSLVSLATLAKHVQATQGHLRC